MIWGIDPEKFWIYTERRTTGCFACRHSKRAKKDGRMVSFCEIEELHESNYPDETNETCRYWRQK